MKESAVHRTGKVSFTRFYIQLSNTAYVMSKMKVMELQIFCNGQFEALANQAIGENIRITKILEYYGNDDIYN